MLVPAAWNLSGNVDLNKTAPASGRHCPDTSPGIAARTTHRCRQLLGLLPLVIRVASPRAVRFDAIQVRIDLLKIAEHLIEGAILQHQNHNVLDWVLEVLPHGDPFGR